MYLLCWILNQALGWPWLLGAAYRSTTPQFSLLSQTWGFLTQSNLSSQCCGCVMLTPLWVYHRDISSTGVHPCRPCIKQLHFLLQVNGAVRNALQR